MDENNMSALSNMSVVNQFPKFGAGKTDAEVDYESSYRVGVKEIERLLKKDKSKDKPKKLFDSNFKPTKKALKYNRKLIREGKTTSYLERQALFLPKEGAVGIVMRNAYNKQGKLQAKLASKYNVKSGVGVIKKSDDKFTKTFTAPNPIDAEAQWKGQGLENNDLLKELAKGLNGKYRIIITIDNKVVADKTLTIGDDLLTDWQVYENEFRIKSSSPPAMVWNADKDGNLLQQGTKVSISFIPLKKLTKKEFKQYYKHGLTNCLLTPIKDYFLEMSETRKTKPAQQKAFNRLNKVFEYICDYRDGVPESKIKDICDELQIAIKLEQPFSNEIYYSYTSMKKPSKVFKMINTRIDHVDYLEQRQNKLPSLDNMYNDATPQYVDRKELDNLYNAIQGESVVTQKDSSGSITSLRTLDNYYAIQSDFAEQTQKFETSTGLRYVGFDALQYPNLMKFVNRGTHFNGTIDFIDTYKWRLIGKNDAPPKGIRHIDQKKAYANFHKSKFYSGFMGKITDFRKINHKKYNGLYFITDIDFSNCDEKFIKLNEQLHWYYDNNVYPKADLDALEYYGATFTITHGAYGINMDFRFNDEMLNGIEEHPNRGEVKYYAKYCGMLASLRPYKNFYMKGNRKLLQTINQTPRLKIYENPYDDEHCIAFKKKHLYSKKHITAQITSYQRLCMMEQLMEMDLDKIARVCVDGIYYFQHEFKVNDGFNEKWDFTFRNEDCDNYLSNVIVSTEEFEELVKDDLNNSIAEPREFYKTEFFSGAGGTGKTHYNLYIDTGLIHPIYVAPSWKLATDMAKQYKEKTKKTLRVTVLNRLLSDAYPDIVLKHHNYIIDEASMILEGQKKQLFNTILGKIIMIGDLQFQLKPVYIQDKEYEKLVVKKGKDFAESYKSQMNLVGFNNIQEFTQIYRFTCDKLKHLAEFVRNNIRNVIDMKNLPYIKYITINELKSMYQKEDMILRFHNEKKHKNLKNNYTNIFENIEKYKVTSNYTQFKNGEIVYEKPNNVTCIEKRHAYTTHSVQGLTFENNIFIDLTGMKYQNRMIYTAISRARKISQLYIIKDV